MKPKNIVLNVGLGGELDVISSEPPAYKFSFRRSGQKLVLDLDQNTQTGELLVAVQQFILGLEKTWREQEAERVKRIREELKFERSNEVTKEIDKIAMRENSK